MACSLQTKIDRKQNNAVEEITSIIQRGTTASVTNDRTVWIIKQNDLMYPRQPWVNETYKFGKASLRQGPLVRFKGWYGTAIIIIIMIIIIIIWWYLWCHHYGKPLREFTRFVWWMLTKRRVAVNPDQVNQLGLRVRRKRLLTFASTIAIYYLPHSYSI